MSKSQTQDIADVTVSNVEWLASALDKAETRSERIRSMGNDLAAAVRAFYDDRDEDKLRAVYMTWMQADSGNFA
jgi:hypothetical protein